MNRFFAGKENIFADEIVINKAEDVHHIKNVLRLKKGSAFIVFDSEEWEYEVELSSVRQSEIRARIIDKNRSFREPEIKITLFQGVPKHGKMETIIQKSVELGVSHIVPVFTARSIGKTGVKHERLQKVAEEAVKQCRRAFVPSVSKEIRFLDMIDLLGDFETVIFAYENEENRSIKSALKTFETKPLSLALVIGPEGGFSEEEAEALAGAGASAVSLGRMILRTETAGPAAIAMIMYELEL